MELHEFIEKFLPDYEQKMEDCRVYCKRGDNIHYGDAPFEILYQWNFHEALQNFADKICKEQKKMMFKATFEENGKYPLAYPNCEQPKIEEL